VSEPLVHDHLDGMEHCVECGGPCQLTGVALLLSNVIRHIFEEKAYNGSGFSMMLKSAIEGCGVDVEKFRRRADVTK
jgi:hypothetical protein